MLMEPITCALERYAFGQGPGGAFIQADVRDLSVLAPYAGRAQMVYLDPPFFTGQRFSMSQRLGERGWRGAKDARVQLPLYADQFASRAAYLDLIRCAVAAAKRLLRPDGSLYLHCDYRMSAHLRLLLDEELGPDCFRNEIVWHYHTGGRAKDHFSRKHDTILFYGLSPTPYFDREAIAVPRGPQKRNHMKREVDAQGRVTYSIRSNGKLYTYREDDPVYPDDVWDDIPHLQQRDPERTGYDTQKPVQLLRRMLLASTRPGDLVADLFAGSGTTAAAAVESGRSWLAVDASPLSLLCHRRRLAGTDMTLSGGCAQDGFAVECEQSGGGYALRLQPSEEIEWFAGGFLEADGFHSTAASARSRRSPGLETLLYIGQGQRPGALLADYRGNRYFFAAP